MLQTLNGELLDIDSARGYARFRFEVVPAFCHSQGRICQGGFLTGMVDTAMANAAIVKGRLAVAVPTLELKISFFEAMGPGIVYAEGRVMRWGGSVGFLDGDLKDEKGRLIVHATSTVKIVPSRRRVTEPSNRAQPVLGDLAAGGEPGAALRGHVRHDAVEGGDAAGPADHAQMQADRHHLRSRSPSIHSVSKASVV